MNPGPANPGRAETVPEPPVPSSRIFTIPNLISFARLAGVPLFLYLHLVAKADVAAVVVLIVGGSTDWVDGYIARRTNQVSRLGELLDPAADRLYIVATLLSFTARGVLPVAFTVALLAREAVLGVGLLLLRRNGYGPPPVHYLGKTATFMLLAAFPLLLLAKTDVAGTSIFSAFGWAFGLWGLAFYWIAAALYLAQTRALLRDTGTGE